MRSFGQGEQIATDVLSSFVSSVARSGGDMPHSLDQSLEPHKQALTKRCNDLKNNSQYDKKFIYDGVYDAITSRKQHGRSIILWTQNPEKSLTFQNDKVKKSGILDIIDPQKKTSHIIATNKIPQIARRLSSILLSTPVICIDDKKASLEVVSLTYPQIHCYHAKWGTIDTPSSPSPKIIGVKSIKSLREILTGYEIPGTIFLDFDRTLSDNEKYIISLIQSLQTLLSL